MKKSGMCPKCGSKSLKSIKDIFHPHGGGNISWSKHMFIEDKNKTALLTFYICENCGFVEKYLDSNELNKVKNIK